MAQHKSAKKRNSQNIVIRARNSGIRSNMRRAIKEARAAAASNADDKAALFKEAVTQVNRAKSRNVLNKSTASRYVSRLMRAAR